MKTLETRGRRTAEAIGNHEEFNTGGSLCARRSVRGIDSGRLPRDWAARFDSDRDRIVYVVVSYITPIAWVLDDGTVRIPNVKFSVTTTKHQGNLYLLNARPWDEV